MHRIFLNTTSCLALVVLFLFTQTSCSKENGFSEGKDKAIVNFQIATEDINLNKVGSTNTLSSENKYYQIDKDNVLEVSFSSSTLQGANIKSANTVSSAIREGVTYRFYIFDADTDTLCADIIHTIGRNIPPQVELIAGKSYKFLAFTFDLDEDFYNKIPDLPAGAPRMQARIYPELEFSNSDTTTTVKKLSEASLSKFVIKNLSDVNDISENNLEGINFPFYFFRKDDLGPLQSGENNIDVLLRQIHCEVGVRLDYSYGGYNSGSITANFASEHILNTSLTGFNLSNGAFITNNLDMVPMLNLSKDRHIFHMTNTDNDATLRINVNLQKAGVNTIRSITLNANNGYPVILKNGLKYNVNIRVINRINVPVDVEVIRLYHDEGDEVPVDYYW